MVSPTTAIVTDAPSAAGTVLPNISTRFCALAHGVKSVAQTGSSSAVTPRIAPYPFNNIYSDADAILQAANGTHFYVHRSTMRIASKFFSEMFSLPQPSPFGSNERTSCPELPIIPVTEDSNTLETLLRLCYPVEDPEEHDPQTLAAVLGAANKYEMRVITASLIKALSLHVEDSPLYVFAVAYKCDILQVAGEALREYLAPYYKAGKRSSKSCTVPYKRRHALNSYSTELDGLPCAVYYRLLECHAAATYSSTRPSSLPQSDIDAMVKSIMSCPSGSPSCHEKQQHTERLRHPFQDSSGTDTIIRSSDYAEFYVHRSFLAFASPVFTRMFSPPPATPPSDSVNETEGDNPLHSVYRLPEDGRTLSWLFQLSYPMPDPALDSLGSADVALGSALTLLDAARKYEISRAVAFAKRACVAATKDKPVQLYLIASRYKWDDVARHAAMRAVYEPSDRYLPEMEYCTTAAYRRLLVYRQKCRDIILSGGEPTTTSISTPATPPTAVTPDSDQPRNVRAPYWSTSGWLSCPEEARFWRALHEYVNDNIMLVLESDQGVFMGDVEAMLPRSVLDGGNRAARGRPEGEQSPRDVAPEPETLIQGQQELKRIAHALAKVSGYNRCACVPFVTCVSTRSNFD